MLDRRTQSTVPSAAGKRLALQKLAPEVGWTISIRHPHPHLDILELKWREKIHRCEVKSRKGIGEVFGLLIRRQKVEGIVGRSEKDGPVRVVEIQGCGDLPRHGVNLDDGKGLVESIQWCLSRSFRDPIPSLHMPMPMQRTGPLKGDKSSSEEIKNDLVFQLLLEIRVGRRSRFTVLGEVRLDVFVYERICQCQKTTHLPELVFLWRSGEREDGEEHATRERTETSIADASQFWLSSEEEGASSLGS